MAEQQDAWEDLSAFRMDPESIQECINTAPGCSVTWVDKNGRAMSVWITPAIIDGEVWVTTTTNRSKTKAWLKDPRTTVVFGVPGFGSVTIVGKVELTDDPQKRRLFLETLYDGIPRERDDAHRELWMKSMDTEGRITGRIKVEKYITFDERKLPQPE